MDENQIENDLHLIQELLNCPSEEEREILQDNLDLVDLGFLQVGDELIKRLVKER